MKREKNRKKMKRNFEKAKKCLEKMIPRINIKKLERKEEGMKIRLMIARKLEPIHRHHKTIRMEPIILI